MTHDHDDYVLFTYNYYSTVSVILKKLIMNFNDFTVITYIYIIYSISM